MAVASEGRNRFSGNHEGEFGNKPRGNKPTEFQPETNGGLLFSFQRKIGLLAVANS
jgi:hypothetical protein